MCSDTGRPTVAHQTAHMTSAEAVRADKELLDNEGVAENLRRARAARQAAADKFYIAPFDCKLLGIASAVKRSPAPDAYRGGLITLLQRGLISSAENPPKPPRDLTEAAAAHTSTCRTRRRRAELMVRIRWTF